MWRYRLETEWIVLFIMIAVGDVLSIPAALYYIRKMKTRDEVAKIAEILENVRDGAEHFHVQEMGDR